MVNAVPMDRVNSNMVSPMALGRGGGGAMGGFGSRQQQSQANNVGNIIKRDPSNLNIANYRRNYDNNEKCLSSQLLFGQGISHKSPTRFGKSTNN